MQKMKRPTNEWEKIFANDILDKGLISKIYRKLIQQQENQTTQLKKKWTEDLNRHCFPKRT